ncbi:leucine-rich repeat neuronal protein 4 [Genypterus blacodes]|uniref:leucine-rich repeat neuronal protein 4 n=1 Tax=Genypterus blacodes TaxID=154954 RepID=UPI003F7604AF
MAASRDLPLLLMIVCLVFIRGYTPLAATSTRVKGTNLTRPLRPRGSSPGSLDLNPSDYEDLDDVDMSKPVTPIVRVPDAMTRQRCNYNPCLENQTPCSVLAANTSCLCPGSTLYNVLPEAPKKVSVRWNGSEVVVQWCAPLSRVTAYRVTVGGREQARFGQDRRSGGVGDINRSATVCVAAVSDAGVGKDSCATYDPKDHSLALTAGLIGGALGFLLLFTLLFLLWRHMRQRKAESRISMQDVAET